MKHRSESGSVTRNMCIGLFCMAGLGLTVYLWPSSESIAPAASAVKGNSSGTFGPGKMIASGSSEPSTNDVVSHDTSAPGGLATTGDEHLVVNKALRSVIDYFLLSGHPGSRAEHRVKLLAHLKAKLPEIAFKEAALIVDKYITYLDALAKSAESDIGTKPQNDANVLSLDVERLAASFSQRSRLRQTILGVDIARIWYGEDEAGDQDVLAEIRGEKSPSSTPQNPAQQAVNKIAAMRAQGASAESQRQEIATQFGAEAAARFDGYLSAEKEWDTRYADYKRSAEEIKMRFGTDQAELEKNMKALRAQKFSKKSEQIRARALDKIAASGQSK